MRDEQTLGFHGRKALEKKKFREREEITNLGKNSPKSGSKISKIRSKSWKWAKCQNLAEVRNPLGRIVKAPERLVPEKGVQNCIKFQPDTRTDFWPSCGWIDFWRAFGLRIERNKSLNWMIFRYARSGVTRVPRFRGTHFQKLKTCDMLLETNPTRERKYFYASINTSNHF